MNQTFWIADKNSEEMILKDRLRDDNSKSEVLVSSPDLKHQQILGAIALDGQTGEEISQGVLDLLNEYCLTDLLVGLSFDTTASNTGSHREACSRIENEFDKSLLWLACRRHVLELHIKHVSQIVAKQVAGRKQSGPDNTRYTKLKDKWPEVLHMIDMNNLNILDWDKIVGTELEQEARRALGILSDFVG